MKKLPTKKIGEIIHKQCGYCNIFKPLNNEHFHIRKDLKNKTSFKSNCIDCHRLKLRKRVIKVEYINKENLIFCTKCANYKEEEFFIKRFDNKSGFRHVCKQCNEKPENYFKYLLKGIKTRAKSNKIIFELTEDILLKKYIKQNKKCAISNIELSTKRNEGKIIFNLSVDRINPNNGYVEDNIQLVCNIVNIMKHNLSMENFVDICNNIVKYQNSLK